jgi:hypothetical protein
MLLIETSPERTGDPERRSELGAIGRWNDNSYWLGQANACEEQSGGYCARCMKWSEDFLGRGVELCFRALGLFEKSG